MTDTPAIDPAIQFVTSLIGFQAAMPVIPKDKTASVPLKSGGQYRYKYADLGAIVPVVMPLLGTHGFAHSCTSRYTPEGFILTGNLMHIGGHVMTAELPMFGTKFQEIGGSITYGRRYLLCLQTGIITDEDDDAQGVNDSPRTRTEKNRPQAAEPIPLPPEQRITKEQIDAIKVYDLSDSTLGQIIESECGKSVTGWEFVTRQDGDRILKYLDPTTASEPAADNPYE